MTHDMQTNPTFWFMIRSPCLWMWLPNQKRPGHTWARSGSWRIVHSADLRTHSMSSFAINPWCSPLNKRYLTVLFEMFSAFLLLKVQRTLCERTGLRTLHDLVSPKVSRPNGCSWQALAAVLQVWCLRALARSERALLVQPNNHANRWSQMFEQGSHFPLSIHVAPLLCPPSSSPRHLSTRVPSFYWVHVWRLHILWEL